MEKFAMVVGGGKDLQKAAIIAEKRGFKLLRTTEIPEGVNIQVILTDKFERISGIPSRIPQARIFTPRFYKNRMIFEDKLDGIRFSKR